MEDTIPIRPDTQCPLAGIEKTRTTIVVAGWLSQNFGHLVYCVLQTVWARVEFRSNWFYTCRHFQLTYLCVSIDLFERNDSRFRYCILSIYLKTMYYCRWILICNIKIVSLIKSCCKEHWDYLGVVFGPLFLKVKGTIHVNYWIIL